MRRHRTRTTLGLAVGAASAMVALASVVWACTAQLPIGVSPNAAAPQASATVSGGSTPGAVEIRWDGDDGPLIATAKADAGFAVGVRIPDASPGVHTIVALTRGADGTVTSRGVASFDVMAPSAAPAGNTAVAGQWQVDTASSEVVATPSASTGFSQLATGVGLLGAGLAALFGGFAVAGVRRRRALAPTVTRSR